MADSYVVPDAEVRSRRRLWKSTVALAFAVAFLGMGPAWLDPPDALAQENDPPQLSVSLEFDGLEPQVFTELQGITTEVVAVGPQRRRPTPKLTQSIADGKLSAVVSRPLSADRDLWDWHQRIIESGRIRELRSGSIVVFDAAGGEIARWNFTNGWPAKVHTGGAFVALGDGSIHFLVETVTIHFQKIEAGSP